jgi:hypothetical protein
METTNVLVGLMVMLMFIYIMIAGFINSPRPDLPVCNQFPTSFQAVYPMENQLFEKIAGLRIIICRQCQYGVRPADIRQHLKRQHQYSHQAASQVADMVHQWEDIQQESEDIHIPLALDHPLPVLPCHRDGILCQREPTRCQYMAASMNSMRKHWKTSHQWSQQSRGGRVGQREQARGQAELARSYRRVAWQQVFPTRKGSHYIHIKYPDGQQSPPPPPAEQAQQVVDAMLAAWERARAQHEQQATIQADEATNPGGVPGHTNDRIGVPQRNGR